MLTTMDSGVETGNDSNDSSAQDKLSKIDHEFNMQLKTCDMEETNTSQCIGNRCGPSTSEIMNEDARSSSLTQLQPASLMHGYEYHSQPAASEFQFRHCMVSKLDFTNSNNICGVGGPFGTEYKAKDLLPKFMHRRRCTIMHFRKARRPNPCQHNYCTSVRETLRMCRAVCHNNTEAMREMLEAGLSPNCHDSYKRTPLHLAACMGYANMVKLLLDHGADPNAKDSIGNTPLHLAACTNHIAVITLLLKAGTRVTERDLQGHSPLQLAITKFKIMKRSIMPHPVLKEQVCQVIAMLSEYMRRKEGSALDPDLLNKFETMVRVSDSSEQVETNIRDLLNNLSSLSLSNTS